MEVIIVVGVGTFEPNTVTITITPITVITMINSILILLYIQ